MGEEAPHLRIVGPEELRRRRRPGPAVISVLLYALAFGVALWYLAARSSLWRKPGSSNNAGSSRSVDPLSVTSERGDAETRTSQRASSAEAAALAAKAGSDASQSRTRGRGETPVPRDSLLAGEGLAEPARSRYFSRLATERCDCGCGRTLSDCLANEKSCSRSPALAEKLRKTRNGKR